MTDNDIDFSTTEFLFSISLIYIALKHGQFLNWASGLSEPWTGLATVLIWIGTVIGYVSLALIVATVVLLIILGIRYVIAEVIE